MNLDMENVGHVISLRVLTVEDHAQLVDLQRRCFGDMGATTLEQLRRARHYGTVTPLRDRRSDLYTVNFQPISDSKVVFPKEDIP